MKNLDEYGKGRHSVLNEIEAYCQDKLETAIEAKPQYPSDPLQSHKRAHLAGVIQTLSRVLQLIEKKQNNLKEI